MSARTRRKRQRPRLRTTDPHRVCVTSVIFNTCTQIQYGIMAFFSFTTTICRIIVYNQIDIGMSTKFGLFVVYELISKLFKFF